LELIPDMLAALSEQKISPNRGLSMRCSNGRPKKLSAVPASPPVLCAVDLRNYLADFMPLVRFRISIVGDPAAPEDFQILWKQLSGVYDFGCCH